MGLLLKNDAWDHPRSRGVYTIKAGETTLKSGSSPLARGLLGFEEYAGVLHGIIPARAGFTARDDAQGHDGQDHPRSRGVYWI